MEPRKGPSQYYVHEWIGKWMTMAGYGTHLVWRRGTHHPVIPVRETSDCGRPEKFKQLSVDQSQRDETATYPNALAVFMAAPKHARNGVENSRD